jgi:hypothetical protein
MMGLRSYYVGADEVYVAPNWSITDKINARSTLSATITDALSATVANGKTFKVYDGLDKIFEGIIVNYTKIESAPGYIEYSLSIADNSAIADRRIIAKVYESEFAGDIVKDIITEVLGAENVIEGTIQNGPLITKAVFNYVSCAQALDYIKKTTGYVWNIDKDKQLHFFERSTNAAPYALDDTVQHYGFSQESAMDEYRNTQYVRGGRGKTATQTEEIPSPKPDGDSRSFVLRFPVAQQPTIELNIGGGGWVAVNSADIGVNGLNTGKKWYWSYNSNIVSQDETEGVLTDADAIRSTYIGLRNLFTKVESLGEIATRAAIESNSGIYESMAIEKSLTESAQALEFGQGLVLAYGEIKDRISFKTEVAGLEAGQLLTVNKALYGISDTYLIESINIYPADPHTLEYSVTAIDGVSVGGWEEFFKSILKDGKDFAIAENEVLILLNNVSESEGVEGSVNIQVFNALYPADDLYPANDLYPNIEVASEVTLSD